MAIIIPSKNIYEITNQKVIDNEVDKIEVSAKNAVPDNHYSETVYNENVEEGFYDNIVNVIDTNHDLYAQVIPFDNPRMPFYACSVCANAQYYLSKTIYIPFVIDNTHILNGILTGVDKNGNTNISYSCSGRIINGHTTSSITVIMRADGYRLNAGSSAYLPPLTEEGYIIETEEENTYNIPTEETNNYSDSDYTVNTKISIDRKDNVATVEAQKVTINGKEYLQIDLKDILCGIRIIKTNGSGIAFPDETYVPSLGTGNLVGRVTNNTYIQYIPKQVSITIYGNTIGIDLQDNTVEIGSGQHVYSFDGNELMQTSNTPSIDSKYNKVIKQWKNGKEVATIKCGIDEYWENKEEEITITVKSILPYSVIYKRIEFTSDTPLRDGANFSNHATKLKDAIDIYEISRKENGTYSGFVLSDETPIINKEYIGTTNWKLVIDPQTGMRPLTFQIGDMVIPYIMGADGNDKPMSFYSDKTPKWFKVIGKGIIADGQIMQELTLQEMSDGEATISIGGETGAGEGTAFVEMTVVNGEVEVGDVLIFNNETAEITQQEVGIFSGEYYVFRCSVNGEFYKNMGNTITVKVRK